MTENSASLSEAELAVLKVLWERGELTVRELRDELEREGRHWAHTTISTLLARLGDKGCVGRDASGFAHVYEAAVSREQFVQQQLASLANGVCDGTRMPLMLALVEGQKFSKKELSEFRELLDRLESRSPRKRKSN